MKRSLLALTTCALIALIGAADEPVVPDSGVGQIPLTLGNRWIYRVVGQDERLTITAASWEKVGDIYCLRLDGRFQGRVIATEHVAMGKDGLYRHRNDGADLEPPLLICKIPVERGETWRAEYKVNDKKAAIEFECDQEEVKVPAGIFKAIVVRAEAPDGTGKLKNTVWYAPKVGMVKQVVVDGDKTITLLLDRFERAGDKEAGPKNPLKKGLK
jgi:hypothetical protein